MRLFDVALAYGALAGLACSGDATSAATSNGAGGGSGGANTERGAGTAGTSSGTSSSGVAGNLGEPDGSSGVGGNTAGGGASGEGGSAVTPNASKACSPIAAGDHEQYHLPAPTNLPAGASSQTDWASNPTSGGWYGAQIMDSCRMHPDGFLTWHGKGAVRVEVDPNDDPLALGAKSERAEMLTLQTSAGIQILEDVEAGVEYYAISYYFPAGWGGTQLPWSAFQSVDCAAGDQHQCNSWSFVMQFHGDTIAWGGLVAAQTTLGGPQHYEFTLGDKDFPFPNDGPIALGKWTDFVLQMDWTSGALDVWRRDEGQTAFTAVANGTATLPAEKMYLKQGLYRGANLNGRVDIFWIGPTARGPSFAVVEQAAYGTSNGP